MQRLMHNSQFIDFHITENHRTEFVRWFLSSNGDTRKLLYDGNLPKLDPRKITLLTDLLIQPVLVSV